MLIPTNIPHSDITIPSKCTGNYPLDYIPTHFKKGIYMRMIMLIILIPILSVSNSFAHPHMFIDTEMEVRLSGNSFSGVEITWSFDPMFTAAITSDFDRDRNGQFSQEETDDVFASAFSNLESSDYFTFVAIDGDTYSPSCIEDFEVFLENDALVYRFFCPFNKPVLEKEFRIAIYDSSFYCDILYKEGNPITLSGNPDASFTIEQNNDISISYGGSVSVSREGSNYSGTAFPQQLVVSFNSD